MKFDFFSPPISSPHKVGVEVELGPIEDMAAFAKSMRIPANIGSTRNDSAQVILSFRNHSDADLSRVRTHLDVRSLATREDTSKRPDPLQI